jgi:hypothetical protein
MISVTRYTLMMSPLTARPREGPLLPACHTVTLPGYPRMQAIAGPGGGPSRVHPAAAVPDPQPRPR